MKNGSFRNFKNGFETVNNGEGNAQPKAKKSGGKAAVLAVLAVILVFLGLNSAYEIKEQEQAVLITLGKAQAVTEPGLHFKIPFIQQVRKDRKSVV